MFSQALNKLVTTALANRGDDLVQPRYHLHQLTRTFLSSQIVQPLAEQLNQGDQITPFGQTFKKMVLDNITHWQTYLVTHSQDTTVWQADYQQIVAAIAAAIPFTQVADETWAIVYQLIETLSPYMERWGYWTAWQSVLTQGLGQVKHLGQVTGIRLKDEVSLACLHA